MSKLKEVSLRLTENLNPIFEEQGFQLKKSEKYHFIRKEEGNAHIFDLSFYNKSKGILIKPELRIKNKEIEDIYKANTEIKGRPYKTLGNHLLEIARYIDHGEETGNTNAGQRWIVQNDEHLEKLISVIPDYLFEIMLPYFDSCSSVSKVDELLNKHPTELSVHHYLFPSRANVAIIAAKLNNNPNYTDLVDIYDERMKNSDTLFLDEYNSIKEYNRSVSGL